MQKVGMLTPWLEAFPRTASAVVDEIDSTLGYRLSSVIEEGPSRSLTATRNAQPAIMATSVLILRVLGEEFGFRPFEADSGGRRRVDVALGHSLGEFSALVAAGVLRFPDALRICARRAEAMAEATRRAREAHAADYGMVAVVTEPEYLEGLVAAVEAFRKAGEGRGPGQEVHVANVNSKNQIVLSGDLGRIRELVAHVRQFLGHDPRAVRLNSDDTPFHSPVMAPAVATMRELLAGRSGVPGCAAEPVVRFPGAVECVSNVTARPFGSADEVRDLLARQCLETVRWWDSIRYLDQERRVRRWLGIGPGYVGRNLVGKEVGMRGADSVKGGGVWAITDPVEIEDVLRELEKTEALTEEEQEE